ncbi:MAG: RodZ domain-containing protein [Anaerolineales bacterium]|jgi:transcriptional regulator with XRE-family HTH domain
MTESLGTVLRQRRESLRVSLEEVERKTYIRARFLAAIENDDLSAMPSEAQARGFIRTYATYLGMDGEELLVRAGGVRPKPPPVFSRPAASRPVPGRSPVRLASPWRRFVRLDVLLSGMAGIVVIGLLAWGSLQLAGYISRGSSQASLASSMVLSSGTELGPAAALATSTKGADVGGGGLAGITGLTPEATPLGGVFTTVDLQVVARHETYLRVVVDGKEVFNGRMFSGDIQSFQGNHTVALYAGDGSALQVEYDGQDQGSLGGFGETLIRIWTLSGPQTPTPTISPSQAPTGTLAPTPGVPAPPAVMTISPGG